MKDATARHPQKVQSTDAEAAHRDPGRAAEGVPESAFRQREFLDPPELVTITNKDSSAAERFRQLATKLFRGHGTDRKVLQVTSALPGEGKTTVAANTAIAGVLSGFRVLLMDVDFRRPRLQSWIRPTPALGLSDALSGKTEVEHAIVSIKELNLHVLPAGRRAHDALDLLGSNRMAEILDRLRRTYDRIVLDAPPTLPFADAATLASWTDGVVLVVRAGVTEEKAYEEALEVLPPESVIGVVFNGYSGTVFEGYDRYDKYYRYYKENGPKTGRP